jgi:hypothetical protein
MNVVERMVFVEVLVVLRFWVNYFSIWFHVAGLGFSGRFLV